MSAMNRYFNVTLATIQNLKDFKPTKNTYSAPFQTNFSQNRAQTKHYSVKRLTISINSHSNNLESFLFEHVVFPPKSTRFPGKLSLFRENLPKLLSGQPSPFHEYKPNLTFPCNSSAFSVKKDPANSHFFDFHPFCPPLTLTFTLFITKD